MPWLLAVLVCALLGTSGTAVAADAVDPMQKGPFAIQRAEYSAGDLLLKDQSGRATLVPLRGSVTFPTGTAKPSKVVVFLHGNYAACYDSSGSRPRAPGDGPASPTRDACAIADKANSFMGYDYLSDNLSSHGYVVISAEANFSGVFTSNGAPGNLGRSQLLQATLEVADAWNHGVNTGLGWVDPDQPASSRPSLTGKLDLDGGIGLMGHSRGGDGVTHFIEFNRNNQIGKQWPLSGVLALAPVQSAPATVPEGTNYATLLPACDGDVTGLSGGNFYGASKYRPGNDGYAKIQWYVEGANHDFYNTIWGSAQDDAEDYAHYTGGCGATDPQTGRLTQDDERKTGIALIDGFMRRYVGNETALDPLMTGQTTLPSSACPSGPGVARVACGDVVRTSYVGPTAQRFDVLRPGAGVGPPTVDDAGGAVTPTGLTRFELCDPQTSTPVACPSRGPSWGPQLTVGWSGPGSLELGTAADGASADVSGAEALTFAMAVDYGLPENPNDEEKDLAVTLTDADGKRASTRVGNWTASTRPAMRNITVLNGVRIPVSAFDGIDMQHVTDVTFEFAGTGLSQQGVIQLADVSFLHPAPPAPTTPEPPSIPEPDGPQPPLGTVISPVVTPLGTPEAPAPSAPRECADETKPTVRFTSVRKQVAKGSRRVSVTVRGRSRDRSACATVASAKAAAKGGVARTMISVSQPVKGRCRFLTAKGRWTARRSCGAPVVLRATGKGAAWSRTLRFAAGSVSGSTAKAAKVVEVRAWSYDRAGNSSAPSRRTVHVPRR